MSYIPKKYHASIADFYKDQDGYWLYLKENGEYVLQFYDANYVIHEDTINDILEVFRDCAVKV